MSDYASERNLVRERVMRVLSDGNWYTYEAMVIKLPAYALRTIQLNTQRLRTEGLVISREITEHRYHGPALMFALAEADE